MCFNIILIKILRSFFLSVGILIIFLNILLGIYFSGRIVVSMFSFFNNEYRRKVLKDFEKRFGGGEGLMLI